ncbi:RluA family pseudouridine synthase [Niveispirillum sp.]|uniref:RluA family pseudouridine synthase n=1 Tax=Niveispirillum sp. TaxID=1917217 RepID=UPI001B555ADA|nr:RluA family pseudouridine synthase [Niveispirillum sp.]MBP7336837.1 RluA family pseudouridine synthase [Niveispirillum sp.]
MPYDAEEMQRRVLYQDDRIIILDKPYGLPVHFGTRTKDHLELYLPLIQGDRPEPPRLAHRLDKDTAGCLVLARDAEAAARLGAMFLDGRVQKTYWAVVLTGPKAGDGVIDLPLEKVWVPGGSKVVVDVTGKPALSRWQCRGRAGGLALLELYPRTGRMHQLRAHCAYMAMPILGDPIYGADRPAPCPLHLLARSIRFPNIDGSGSEIMAVAPPPPHMAATLTATGLAGVGVYA